MSNNWHVQVDRSRCAGTTICASTAPKIFTIAADGQSRSAEGPVEPAETVRRAAELCPVEAISLFLASTGEELFPGQE